MSDEKPKLEKRRVSLEITGPPSVVGFSEEGFTVAEGPAGLLIEFAVVSKPLEFGILPPYAIIGIRTIGT